MASPESSSSSFSNGVIDDTEKRDVEMKELGQEEKLRDVDLEDEEVDFSRKEESDVLKKLDRRVVLFIAGLYLLSFLDRSNIGNARIAGLERDLRLTSAQYEWLLTAFYITYILFQWMALLFRLIPPHIYIGLCVLAWGIIASLQALTTSFPQLLILRALLGVSEAAFAGIPFYLSFFFRRKELAARVGVFISAAPLATTFASSLAWGITALGSSGVVPLAPWRLLFLVEGFPSVLVAYWVLRALPDGPESARFLTRREKDIAQSRLRGEDSTEPAKGGKKKLKLHEITQALKDPKCYLTAAMFFSCNVSFSSLPVYLPTLIQSMGHSATTSQALSAPPYFIAFLTVLTTSYLSDKHTARSPFIILHATLAASGYLLILIAGAMGWSSWIRYAGVYPAAAGFFSCVTLIITWTLNNQETDGGKGTGVALLQYFGQLGPLVGTRVYPESDGPLYLKGMAICACFMTLVGLVAYGLRVHLGRENAKRAAEDSMDERGGDGEEDVELLGIRKGKRRKVFYFML